jgi:aldose 1-epimerase
LIVEKELFGLMPDSREALLYTISNSNNIKVKITNYGGIVTSITVPDKKGQVKEITLGFDNLKDYLAGHPYFGAIIGRFANRIAGGRFILNGTEYSVICNEGPNHLHGGYTGFDKVLWEANEIKELDRAGVELSYRSKDGEEGYPGNLDVKVLYSLNENDELGIEYTAETDKKTIINLTNHCYWNLAGAGSGTMTGHNLILNCSRYLPVDREFIPTGEINTVKGTPFDFTHAKPIGLDMDKTESGYDHCFIIDKPDKELTLAARVTEPASGRSMEVYTTKPAIHFYGGNSLKEIIGANGVIIKKHSAFCLEAEYYPDSPNKPGFSSCVLKPGETYNHKTVHRFFITE